MCGLEAELMKYILMQNYYLQLVEKVDIFQFCILYIESVSESVKYYDYKVSLNFKI